jgi:hypothetical protein
LGGYPAGRDLWGGKRAENHDTVFLKSWLARNP